MQLNKLLLILCPFKLHHEWCVVIDEILIFVKHRSAQYLAQIQPRLAREFPYDKWFHLLILCPFKLHQWRVVIDKILTFVKHRSAQYLAQIQPRLAREFPYDSLDRWFHLLILCPFKLHQWCVVIDKILIFVKLLKHRSAQYPAQTQPRLAREFLERHGGCFVPCHRTCSWPAQVSRWWSKTELID